MSKSVMRFFISTACIMTGLFLAFPVFSAGAGEMEMRIASPSFVNNGMIPLKYTARGRDVSPELVFTDIPEDAVSLVLIVDDPDAPAGVWVHWVLYDIPPVDGISEGGSIGEQGLNSFKVLGYKGPSPPSGTHRYFFKLYALDKKLGFSEGKTKSEVEKAAKGHVLSYSELIGLFSR